MKGKAVNYNFKHQGMLKDCIWKGERLNCSAIFSMQPTDQGMCCSFNKQKADEMFRASRYRDEIIRLTDQDKRKSRDHSTIPDWYAIFQFENIFLPKIPICCQVQANP